MDDIAIIGLGLRFPGDATSPESLWEVLEHGQSQWSEIPKDRLNIDGYYHPGGERQGSVSRLSARMCHANTVRSHSKEAIFSKETLQNLMPQYVYISTSTSTLLIEALKFFSIAAADANAIDPQQRLLLEVCYEALENGTKHMKKPSHLINLISD